MHPGPDHLPQLDATTAPSLPSSSSLAARRAAASNLPSNFELPPPPLAALQNKYQSPYAGPNGLGPDISPSANVTSIGSLLTPPNTIPSEQLSPASSNGNGASSIHPDLQSPSSQSQGVPGYNAPYWAPPGAPAPPVQQQVGYPSGSTPQWIPPRGLFSPSLNSVVRSSPDVNPVNSPSYQTYHLPPFGNNLSSPSQMPQMTAAQAQQHQALLISTQQQHHIPTTQASAVNEQEAFLSRPPPPPSYYSSSSLPSHTASTPQHSAYPYTTGSSPSIASPMSASSVTGGRLTPQEGMDPSMSVSSLPSSFQHPSQSPPQYPPHQRAFSHPFSLPAMPVNGSVMSGMPGRGNQMGMVGGAGGMNGAMMPGGYSNGHVASMPHLYRNPMSPQQQPHHSPVDSGQYGNHARHGSQHGGPHQTPGDRPFKCDQCVQSFNRNHDLKRHKRIHLAVKPYPCGHCDKSFSRKDALKRHILVKGCGKTRSSAQADSGSAHIETSSNSSDDNARSVSPTSPVLNGVLGPSSNSPQMHGVAA